jgi:hypothetical protein
LAATLPPALIAVRDAWLSPFVKQSSNAEVRIGALTGTVTAQTTEIAGLRAQLSQFQAERAIPRNWLHRPH